MVCVKVCEPPTRCSVRRKLQSCRQFVAGQAIINQPCRTVVVGDMGQLVAVRAVWFGKDQMVGMIPAGGA